jgi:hypothetical protein
MRTDGRIVPDSFAIGPRRLVRRLLVDGKAVGNADGNADGNGIEQGSRVRQEGSLKGGRICGTVNVLCPG